VQQRVGTGAEAPYLEVRGHGRYSGQLRVEGVEEWVRDELVGAVLYEGENTQVIVTENEKISPQTNKISKTNKLTNKQTNKQRNKTDTTNQLEKPRHFFGPQHSRKLCHDRALYQKGI
jgi:hypothetical protein